MIETSAFQTLFLEDIYEIYYDVSINNETYEGLMKIQMNHPLEEKLIQYGLYAVAGIFADTVGVRK